MPWEALESARCAGIAVTLCWIGSQTGMLYKDEADSWGKQESPLLYRSRRSEGTSDRIFGVPEDTRVTPGARPRSAAFLPALSRRGQLIIGCVHPALLRTGPVMQCSVLRSAVPSARGARSMPQARGARSGPPASNRILQMHFTSPYITPPNSTPTATSRLRPQTSAACAEW